MCVPSELKRLGRLHGFGRLACATALVTLGVAKGMASAPPTVGAPLYYGAALWEVGLSFWVVSRWWRGGLLASSVTMLVFMSVAHAGLFRDCGCAGDMVTLSARARFWLAAVVAAFSALLASTSVSQPVDDSQGGLALDGREPPVGPS